MKKILLPALLLAASLSFGQSFEVTPAGMRSTEGNNIYVIIDAPGKTAAQLFKVAFDFVKTDLKKDNEAYFKEIVNDRGLQIDVTADKGMHWKAGMGTTIVYDISYMLNIEVSEGQAKILLTRVEIWPDDVTLRGKEFPFSLFFNKKGEVKKKEEKAEVESRFAWTNELSSLMKNAS